MDCQTTLRRMNMTITWTGKQMTGRVLIVIFLTVFLSLWSWSESVSNKICIDVINRGRPCTRLYASLSPYSSGAGRNPSRNPSRSSSQASLLRAISTLSLNSIRMNGLHSTKNTTNSAASAAAHSGSVQTSLTTAATDASNDYNDFYQSRRVNGFPQPPQQSQQLLVPLPSTTTDSSFHTVRFRCRQGHTWDARPGSALCTYCPICKVLSRNKESSSGSNSPFATVRGEKIAHSKYTIMRDKVISSIKETVLEKNGKAFDLSEIDFKPSMYSAGVKLQCELGHRWTCSVGNLLYRNSWCPECSKVQARLQENDFHLTAMYFSGKFLGFEDDEVSGETNKTKAQQGMSMEHVKQ